MLIFVCFLADLIRGFRHSYLILETGGLELVSTNILVLQANRLTKCASHPNKKFGTLHKFSGAMLIFSVSFQFWNMCCRSKHLLVTTCNSSGHYLKMYADIILKTSKLHQMRQYCWLYCHFWTRFCVLRWLWKPLSEITSQNIKIFKENLCGEVPLQWNHCPWDSQQSYLWLWNLWYCETLLWFFETWFVYWWLLWWLLLTVIFVFLFFVLFLL